MSELKQTASVVAPNLGGEAPRVRRASTGFDRRQRRARVINTMMATGSVLLFLVFWQLISTYLVNEKLLPSPLTVFNTMIPMFVNEGLTGHIGISMRRIAIGFIWGAIAGIVLGLLIGRLRVFESLFNPPLQFLRFLSPTALIPVAIIWFGIAETSKLFLIFWATFVFSVVTVIQGAQSIPETRLRAAQSLGAGRWTILWRVVLPSAVPFIVGGLRTAVAASFMSIIPAELLAAQSGLGYLLSQATITLDTARVFVILVIFCLLGFLTDALFRLVTKVALRRYTIA